MYNCLRMNELSKKCFVLFLIVFVLIRGSNGQDIAGLIELICNNMADLMALRSSPLVQRPTTMKLPSELKVRKRGKKGGVKARTKRRGFRPVFPTIAISNARSLNHKTDELHARVIYDSFRNSFSLMCFLETWFKGPKQMDIDRFELVRGDRDTKITGKTIGGGTKLT